MPGTLFNEDEHRNSLSLLPDKEIKEHVARGLLIVATTFSEASLEASGYDIRVGAKGVIGGDGKEIDLQNEGMEIPPGAYAAVISHEKMRFPKTIAGRLGAKRALSYDGIILLTGSIVDPGYEGHLLFGLYNASQKKVVIRHRRKICNIVFERLSAEPEKEVSPDPNLLHANFPDAFIDKMLNMDVLPWMQISDRVKEIERLTTDILDLKVKYDDVMKPIAALTENVRDLTKNIETVNKRTETLSGELTDAKDLVNENARQIRDLTDLFKNQEKDLRDVTISFKSSNNWNKIIWTVLIGLLMFGLGLLFNRHK